MASKKSSGEPPSGTWTALATAAFAIVLTLSGLGVCSLPATTWALSSLTSDDETSPYTSEELTDAAVATRDYTVGSHDRAALDAVIDPMEERLAEEQGLTLEQAREGTADSAGMAALSARTSGAVLFGDTTHLPEDAISHLDDVHRVIQPAFAAFGLACATAAGCTVALAARHPRALGASLCAAGGCVLAAFCLFGAWAAVDFDGMFAVFHSLFFAQGTWTFYADSLLICMYPIAFWMGMGAVWLVVTVAGCALCLIIGRSFLRTSRALNARF